MYLLFIDSGIYRLWIPVSTVCRCLYLPCADTAYRPIYLFAVHGNLNTISRTVFKGTELPEYLVRTITVTSPSGTISGMRAIICPILLTERRRLVLYSVPSAVYNRAGNVRAWYNCMSLLIRVV